VAKRELQILLIDELGGINAADTAAPLSFDFKLPETPFWLSCKYFAPIPVRGQSIPRFYFAGANYQQSYDF